MNRDSVLSKQNSRHNDMKRYMYDLGRVYDHIKAFGPPPLPHQRNICTKDLLGLSVCWGEHCIEPARSRSEWSLDAVLIPIKNSKSHNIRTCSLWFTAQCEWTSIIDILLRHPFIKGISSFQWAVTIHSFSMRLEACIVRHSWSWHCHHVPAHKTNH